MFDVDWSDPNRESVGDRRARKDKKDKDKSKARDSQDGGHEEDEDQDDGADDQSGNRTSGSVRSSVSSAEKQFGFFGGKHRKKGTTSSSRKAKTQSVASSSLRSPTIEEQPHSEVASTSSPTHQRPSTSGADKSPSLPPKRFSSFAESVFNDLDDTERAPGGSLFGCDITNPQPGTTTQFQEFGDGVSMVTKTTVVSSRERTQDDSDCLVSKINISTGDYYHHQPSIPAKTLSGPDSTQFNEVLRVPVAPVAPAQQSGDHDSQPPESQAPQQSSSNDSTHLPTIQESSNGIDGADKTANAKRKSLSKRPTRPKLTAPAIPPASLRPTTNADAWKAPDDWAISPTESAISGVGTEDMSDSAVVEKLAALALDLAHMERETQRMLEASPLDILQRLKEDDGPQDLAGATDDQDVADDHEEAAHVADQALACQAREMEKQRWLLSALYNMETIWDTNDKESKPIEKPGAQKILSLFESLGTTSYLAMANSNVSVYHLSSDPLIHKQFPNVHPMLCPIISASSLAFAANTFSTVSCVGVTSMLPSSDMPKLLTKIHRILAPGGLLHMVLIDPSPSATTIGPLLQQWLDEHLLFNLELQFRVTRPSRFFPIWLEEAKLRAQGSIITQTRFPAIAEDTTKSQQQQQPTAAAVNKELRCIVGRLLWKQIWGPFVSGDTWWWEVPEIVDECREKQTHWEYSVIAACKASI